MSTDTSNQPGADGVLQHYELEDRYLRRQGRVYLSGSQALVRLPMMQQQLDAANGLDTAGFISGYTGSPLGGYDTALKQAHVELEQHQIHFQPGVNEDLGAAAVWGSQQVAIVGQQKHDGVFALWYGKGPGVDRSGDALKHGSYSGSAENGGVLVLAGDDHGAKSSTLAHQSDHAFIHFGMPYLNPSSVQDYLDFGLYGFALSRYSGCWVGMKCVTDTIESSASVNVDTSDFTVVTPQDYAMPAGGLNATAALPAKAAEVRHYEQRLPAVRAFVRANGLDKVIVAPPEPLLGIVTTGKAYLDVMQALAQLGLDPAACSELGIGIYKVAMPWPLEPQNITQFARAYRELLVIEEKRPVIEEQLASLFVNLAGRPLLIGKRDEQGRALVSEVGELESRGLARILRRRLAGLLPDADAVLRPLPEAECAQGHAASGAGLSRKPSFCAGCPHNTSTNLPDGSMAFGGIGCHGMATFLPERRTPTLFHMGAEGAPWIGIAPFTRQEHIFQNLGDGTYYHSGLLAIRAAVAAGVNITYKILVNDAIAMTGGQEIEGKMRVDTLSRQLEAEGVRRIAVMGNDPDAYRPFRHSFASGVTLHHRDELDQVQRELREFKGVSVLVYDQFCATELRRRRKRGKAEDPDRRIFINPRVCEGCGDCSIQSNCIAVEPVDTGYGRKRRINQSACNKDFSCTKGYCPSFITVTGGTPRRRSVTQAGTTQGFDLDAAIAALPVPVSASSERPFSLLITGIGGSGVVTLGALIGMAAFLEGKGCSVLDVAGLAQRNGPVTSHIRVADRQQDIFATRIVKADLVLGCDIVVAASDDVAEKMQAGDTRAVINSCVTPTSDFATNPDLNLSAETMIAAIRARLAAGDADFVPSADIATRLMGNEVAGNMFLVGYAMQKGWLPVGLEAVSRAIELNGVSIDMNKRSLCWGRLAAADLAAVLEAAAPSAAEVDTVEQATLASLIEQRCVELGEYQDASYAQAYRSFVNTVVAREGAVQPGAEQLSTAVANYLFKLMAYKDEYEVARLHSAPALMEALRETFEGDFEVAFHLAPPALGGVDSDTGRYPKKVFGSWMLPVFRVLAKLKVLRGTALDPFGYSAHRKLERALIGEYRETIEGLLTDLTAGNYALAVEIASLPEQIRGYGSVKEQHLARAQRRREQLLSEFAAVTRDGGRPDPVKIMAVNVG